MYTRIANERRELPTDEWLKVCKWRQLKSDRGLPYEAEYNNFVNYSSKSSSAAAKLYLPPPWRSSLEKVLSLIPYNLICLKPITHQVPFHGMQIMQSTLQHAVLIILNGISFFCPSQMDQALDCASQQLQLAYTSNHPRAPQTTYCAWICL